MLLSFLSYLILILAITLHEASHAAAADQLGDSTPRAFGRLSLNPLKHLDLIGTVLLPLMLLAVNSPIIGWAKPVPINPFNLRDKKYGQAKVALAGPAANLLTAILFGFLIRFLPFEVFSFGERINTVLTMIVQINLFLGFFNLLPIPPLDGSHILFTFLPQKFDKLKLFLLQYGFFVLIFFIFFLFPLIFVPLVDFCFKILVGIPL